MPARRGPHAATDSPTSPTSRSSGRPSTTPARASAWSSTSARPRVRSSARAMPARAGGRWPTTCRPCTRSAPPRGAQGRCARAAPPASAQGLRDPGDLAVGDLALDLLGRRHVVGVRLRAERAEADAVLVEAEDRVPAARERPVLHRLDRQEDGAVDALERARQDVRAEERLVTVDPDRPDALVLRPGDRSEAATAGDLEDDLRAGRDLVQRQLLALRLVLPVLGVAPLHLRPGDGGLRARAVAGDETVDRRLLEAADGADRLGPRTLRLERAEVADEVAHLLLAEEQPLDVRRLALQRGLVDVDDREVRVRKALRGRGDRVALREPDADDEVVALAREGRHVGDVVRCALRFFDHAADTEH